MVTVLVSRIWGVGIYMRVHIFKPGGRLVGGGLGAGRFSEYGWITMYS